MKKSIAIKNKINPADLIKVAPFRKGVRKTEPHKHRHYFEIIYLSKGSGTHTIDHTSFSIKAPTVFCVRQEQVHHWDITSEPEGYVLLLRKGFMKESLDNELKQRIAHLSAVNCLRLNADEVVETLFLLLTKEDNFRVVEGLLKALLSKIIAVAQPVKQKKQETNDFVVQFRALLGQSENLQNKVAYYAERLHTTPQNLNAACMRSLGQQASAVIAEHIINEAKRLLIYTDNTVSQIAYRLHFKDTSHFIKYFKRYVGATPHVFRSADISH